jgi:hypothetical protein
MPAFDAAASAPTWNPARSLGVERFGGLPAIVQPTDSGMGDVYRPKGTQEEGGFGATPETLFDFWLNCVYDPDEALSGDPTFTQKLVMNPDVASCFERRKLSVSRLPWHIEPSADPRAEKADAQKVADYVKEVFDGLPKLRQLFNILEEAVLWGGQGINLAWAKRDGAVQPVAWVPVHKTRFSFDRLGRMALLTREQPVWGRLVSESAVNPANGERAWTGVPAGAYLYHVWSVNQGTWQLPWLQGYWYYGRGLDVPLHLVVTFDAFVLRRRMKFFDRTATPLAVLSHPDNESPQKINAIGRSIRGESVVDLPKPVGQAKDYFYDLEFIQMPTGTQDLMANFYERWTQPNIEKILLSGGDVMDVGQTGSYSTGVSQHDKGPSIVYEYDAQQISETFNRQFIPHIVRNRPEYKDAPAHLMPTFVMAAKQEKDKAKELEALEKAARMVPIRQEAVYDLIPGAKPGEQDDTVFLGGPEAGFEDLMGQVPTAAPKGAPGSPETGEPGGDVGRPGPSGDGRPVTPVGEGRANPGERSEDRQYS